MPRSCSNVISLLVLIILAFSGTNGHDNSFSASDMSDNMLPQKSDLVVYLKSLRRIIEFCLKNKNDLDMNFEFGLFNMNVNLKSALENKQIQVPKLVRTYVELLLRENQILMDFFRGMVNRKPSEGPYEEANKMITSLFANETEWLNTVPEFDRTLLVGDSEFQEPSSWDKYVKKIDDVDHEVPSPPLSDFCISLLAVSDIEYTEDSTCIVHQQCYDMLTDGSNFGYALCHRALYLLLAKHSRKCSIFSKEVDREMTAKFCATAYEEAKYIAKHSYGVVDLILEQIGLCAFNGYAQFLKQQWLSDLLKFQTPYGCFGKSPSDPRNLNTIRPLPAPNSWLLSKGRDNSLLGGLCNGHVTSVAAATLSAGVRYILETYYRMAELK